MSRAPNVRRLRSLAAWLLGVASALAVARAAHAESPPTIAEVEQAYADVDFERAQTLAVNALRAGYHPPAETRRLYTLLGISGAALGRDDVARRAFIRVLLSDPAQKLDQNLSPKLRAPYLEARGQWASATSERGLGATLEVVRGVAVVQTFDPMNVIHAVELSYESSGSHARATKRHPRKTELSVSTGPIDAYQIRLLDEYGNALFERRGEPALERTTGPSARTTSAEPPNRTPYYVAAGSLGVAGLAGLAGGVVFQLERERLAREWNSSACEEPGSNRAEQCAEIDDDRERAELYAAGLYALGGALLVGGIVTLAVTPGSPDERPALGGVRCDPTLGVFGLACRGRF